MIALLVACSPVSQEFPTGEYVDSNGGVIDFNEDGTYGVSDSDGKDPVIFGVYTVEGNVITIMDNLFYCPDYVGIYYWSLENNRSLELEMIEEECAGRERILEVLTFLRE